MARGYCASIASKGLKRKERRGSLCGQFDACELFSAHFGFRTTAESMRVDEEHLVGTYTVNLWEGYATKVIPL